MKPSVGIAVLCLPWRKEWKIRRKKKKKEEKEREKESGETLMPERGRNGREVGRKWDCLSNSSRARAKDEGRSELGAFRLSALDKSAFPAEEIVSEINSSKLIPPSTLLVRTKRKLVAKHPTFLLLPSLVPNSNFSQKARDRGIPETPFLTESSGWKSLKS